MKEQPVRRPLRRSLGPAAVAIALLAATAAVRADDVGADGAASAPADSAAAAGSPLGVQPLADDVLSGRRGGASTQNDMRLDGVVGSNEAVNVVTGANSVSSGAFAGTAGLPMVIQNSGNNVLIQNATIVNVQIK